MKSFLLSKYFPWILLVVCALVFFKISSCQNTKNTELDTYNRQISGQLTEKERQLQEMNTALGVSKSELLTQKELNNRLNQERNEINQEFEKFKKEHDLIIRSLDQTIAELRQQISGGSSSTTTLGCNITESCVIGYAWEDNLNRFKLKDPNIFEKNNETFESHQVFKINGEIYKQKDGNLQTRRTVLREVYKDGNEYKPVPNAQAEIIDAQFEYTVDPPTPSTWKDLFRLRVVAVGSFNIIPSPAAVNFGLGLEPINFHGLGLNSYTLFNFKDTRKIEQRLGVSYSPTIFGRPLNTAVGLAVGSPFYKMFNEYSISADLIFYVN